LSSRESLISSMNESAASSVVSTAQHSSDEVCVCVFWCGCAVVVVWVGGCLQPSTAVMRYVFFNVAVLFCVRVSVCVCLCVCMAFCVYGCVAVLLCKYGYDLEHEWASCTVCGVYSAARQ